MWVGTFFIVGLVGSISWGLSQALKKLGLWGQILQTKVISPALSQKVVETFRPSVVVCEIRLWFQAWLRVVILFPVLLFIVIIIVVIITVRLFIEVDRCLNREVPQQSLSITVQIVKGLLLGPKQPVSKREHDVMLTNKHHWTSENQRICANLWCH